MRIVLGASLIIAMIYGAFGFGFAAMPESAPPIAYTVARTGFIIALIIVAASASTLIRRAQR
jgi:hypothetical protein